MNYNEDLFANIGKNGNTAPVKDKNDFFNSAEKELEFLLKQTYSITDFISIQTKINSVNTEVYETIDKTFKQISKKLEEIIFRISAVEKQVDKIIAENKKDGA